MNSAALGGDPDAGALGQLAFEEMDDSTFDQAAQSFFRCVAVGGRSAVPGWTLIDVPIGCAAHGLVHGQIRQPVGALILLPQDVLDLEFFELGDAAFGLVVKRTQLRAIDTVLSLDLLDHQLGVGDDLEMGMAVGDREVEGGEQAGIFGEIVGLLAQVFAQLAEGFAVRPLDEDAKTRRSGIAPGSAVAICSDRPFSVPFPVCREELSGAWPILSAAHEASLKHFAAAAFCGDDPVAGRGFSEASATKSASHPSQDTNECRTDQEL